MKLRLFTLLLAFAALTMIGCDDSGGSDPKDIVQDADSSTLEDLSDVDGSDPSETTEPDVPVGCEEDSECTTTTACAVSTCVDGTCQEGPAEDGVACDDGVECTVGVCASGACTSGDLEPGFCQINGECYAEGDPNPENGCEECVASTATDSWTVDDTNSCDDGVSCTQDACVGGVCTPTADDALCDDDNPCTLGTCDVVSGCQMENLENGESCGTAVDPAFCWTGANCTQVTRHGEFGNEQVHHLRFSPDGARLAVAANGSLSVWDVQTMTETTLMAGNWRGVAWSPDGQWIVSANIGSSTSGGAVGTITLVDANSPNTSTALGTMGVPADYLADGSYISVLIWSADMLLPRILDPAADALLDQELFSSNSNSFRHPSASGDGQYIITSEFAGPLKVLDVRDFSTVTELDTELSARFTPDMEHVVYFNETNERFETKELSTGTINTLPAILVENTPFVVGLRGGFTVLPDGESIIAYDDSSFEAETRVVLVRLSDGMSIHLDTFEVGAETASLPRQSMLTDSTGVYTVLPFTNSDIKGFRVYKHEDLWHPWSCNNDSECGATEFCNLTHRTCHVSMCKDGQDNEGDNLIDSADPECASGQLEIADDSQ